MSTPEANVPVQAAVAWPPPSIDELDRTNRTLARDQHPKDHDDLQIAVNAILTILGRHPYGLSSDLSAELERLQATLLAMQADGGVDLRPLREAIELAQATATDAAVAAQRTAIDLAELADRVAHPQHYVHYQRQTADVWVVQHNLGYDPLVEVVRDDNVRVLGFDAVYADDHMSITLSFSEALTGRALLGN